MKEFVMSVVILIAISVSAEEVPPGSSNQEPVHATKDSVSDSEKGQPQAQQTNAASEETPLIGTQQQTPPQQPSGKQGDGEVDPQVTTPGGNTLVVSIVGAIIAACAFVVAYRNFRMQRLLNSPHLSIGEWTIHRPPDGIVYVTCKITNTGGTVATICSDEIRPLVRAANASRTEYREHTQTFSNNLQRTTIAPKHSEVMSTLIAVRSNSWRFVENHQLRVSVYVSVTYRGKWGPVREIRSHVLYDPMTETFSIMSSNDPR